MPLDIKFVRGVRSSSAGAEVPVWGDNISRLASATGSVALSSTCYLSDSHISRSFGEYRTPTFDLPRSREVTLSYRAANPPVRMWALIKELQPTLFFGNQWQNSIEGF